MFGLMHSSSKTSLKSFTFPTKELAQASCDSMNVSCSHMYYEVIEIA